MIDQSYANSIQPAAASHDILTNRRFGEKEDD